MDDWALYDAALDSTSARDSEGDSTSIRGFALGRETFKDQPRIRDILTAIGNKRKMTYGEVARLFLRDGIRKVKETATDPYVIQCCDEYLYESQIYETESIRVRQRARLKHYQALSEWDRAQYIDGLRSLFNSSDPNIVAGARRLLIEWEN
jgi:hypothetical protein